MESVNKEKAGCKERMSENFRCDLHSNCSGEFVKRRGEAEDEEGVEDAVRWGTTCIVVQCKG